MQLNLLYALITFVICRALNEVQSKTDLSRSYVLNKFYRPSLAFRNVRYHKRRAIGKTMIGQTIFDNDIKTQRILKYLKEELPVSLISGGTEEENSIEFLTNDLNSTTNANNREIKIITESVKDAQNIKTSDKIEKATHLQASGNSQRVLCTKIMNNKFSIENNIIDRIQHVCDPPLLVTTAGTLPTGNIKPTLAMKGKRFERFERLATTTPAGTNCWRIMNSELNELGEIIDSVTVVCDPPTTTTTTTRKPTIKTTVKTTTTTTQKPLVKVCRPVMNSYLNEKDEIIDSVTMVCKMENAK